MITRQMFTFQIIDKTIEMEEYIPAVIEPTFGIGRIMYAVLEHNFKIRPENEQRKYFTLSPLIAPYKCSVLSLSGNAEFKLFVKQISDLLTRAGIRHKVDTSSSTIGKRYVRCDEIGIPFAIAIDFDTLQQPHSIVLKEIDSLKQVRVEINEIASVLEKLSTEKITWNEVFTSYPIFTEQQSTKLEK